MNNKRVLCLLVAGFEEIEMIAPVDLLRRAEVEVVIASVAGEKLVRGRGGVVLQAEAMLNEADARAFDLLFIPGGPGVMTLRQDGQAAKLARAFANAGRLVAAICAAPLILKDAGLLAGKRFTAHYSVHGDLPGVLGDERVVKDGLIITSRGPGTAVEFGLALVRELCGDAKAQAVAAEIML